MALPSAPAGSTTRKPRCERCWRSAVKSGRAMTTRPGSLNAPASGPSTWCCRPRSNSIGLWRKQGRSRFSRSCADLVRFSDQGRRSNRQGQPCRRSLGGFQGSAVTTFIAAAWPLAVLGVFCGLSPASKPSRLTLGLAAVAIGPLALLALASLLITPMPLSEYSASLLEGNHAAQTRYAQNVEQLLQRAH